MAESYVAWALVNKRAEIAGMIARTEQQLGQFRAELVHLDATLRLFAPDLEPKTIPAKKIRQADLWAGCYIMRQGDHSLKSPHRYHSETAYYPSRR